MNKWLFLLLAAPLLLGATLQWDLVTTDITGAPDTVSVYRAYTRKAGTSDAWIKFAETPTTSTPVPTPSARMEYTVTAVDTAGNESDRSNTATAKPENPKNATVIR